MEKRQAHYPLSVVHALVEKGQVRATGTALSGAATLDLDFDDMLNVMTTYNDHRIWQDVYQPSTAAGDVYLKLTVIDDVLIVSLKEL